MLAIVVYQISKILILLIVIRAIMSWFVRDLSNPIVKIVFQLTEPILEPFRQILHRFGLGGTLDFSPILAYFTIQIIASFLIRIL